MSWLEKIENTQLTISTGDGEQYAPSWMNASKSVEYNVSTFEFKELSGTLVHRGTPKGARYNLELFFQGEDHLDIAAAFEASAAHPDYWIITHPFYGTINVQPTSLAIDNTKFNVSQVNVAVIETIIEGGPRVVESPADKVAEDVEVVDEELAETYGTDVIAGIKDVVAFANNVNKLYNNIANKIKNTLDFQKYVNAYKDTLSAVNTLVSAPLAAIRATQALINLPAQFSDSVKNRLGMLGSQFDALRNGISNITGFNDKKLYENHAGSVVATMALTTVTNITPTAVQRSGSATPATPGQQADYGNRDAVLAVIDTLLSYYNQYLVDIDQLQSANAGSPGAYVPNATAITALTQLVNYTVANLFTVAAGTRQERTIILEEDSNIILLAYRFYGLAADDSTIDELIESNNIQPNEKIIVPKGRRLVYYV